MLPSCVSDLFAGMSAADKDAVVANFLMGTARPVVRRDAGGRRVLPTRVRSAPAWVDAVRATILAGIAPSVVGAALPSRPRSRPG